MIDMFEVASLVLKAMLSNLIDLKFPYKLTFAVTYRCNARCKICNIWKRSSKNEMSKEEIKVFFRKNRFPWINITGGEPFLRDDLTEIVDYMNGVYLLNITTNGSLPERIVEMSREIKRMIKRLIVTVSIDGPEELHDQLRGVKIWKNAIETFKMLRELGIESYIGYTSSPLNAGMLLETYRSVKRVLPWLRLGDFHLNIYHESEIYYENVGTMKSKNYEKMIRDIETLLNAKKGVRIVDYLERRYLIHAIHFLKTHKLSLQCQALRASCFIDPFWNVYPCTMFGIKLGNLREVNFDLRKIISSKDARRVREAIKKGKCPRCWTPCEAYQTILGNLF